MLIDDNKIDNFFHERIIKKYDAAEKIIVKESGEDALAYLNTNESIKPNIIFLDVNMPGMSGWDFIEEYIQQNHHLPFSNCYIVLLVTEHQPIKTDVLELAKAKDVCVILKYKPVTCEVLSEIIEES